jgi:WD40 repeat protein
MTQGLVKRKSLNKKKTLKQLEVPSGDDSRLLMESTQSHNLKQDSSFAGPNKAVKSFIELLNMGATDSFAEDVTSKLPILQQIEQEWNSNNIVQTPYDCNSLIQTLCNPLNPEQHITVRLVTENVKRNTK